MPRCAFENNETPWTAARGLYGGKRIPGANRIGREHDKTATRFVHGSNISVAARNANEKFGDASPPRVACDVGIYGLVEPATT